MPFRPLDLFSIGAPRAIDQPPSARRFFATGVLEAALRSSATPAATFFSVPVPI